ncbi:lactococcin 972 family bacteriocin [Staphylococcus aureus]
MEPWYWKTLRICPTTYSHNKRNHGSTAVGKYSSFSGVARPGVQSKASAPKAWGGNKTFYSLH